MMSLTVRICWMSQHVLCRDPVLENEEGLLTIDRGDRVTTIQVDLETMEIVGETLLTA